MVVKAVDDHVGGDCFEWIQNIETHESEVINPDQLKSESHVNVDVVDVLDCSFRYSNNNPEESDVVGLVQL
jgi:hypothetical protein